MSALEKTVEEVFSVFRDFIYRDIFYIFSGVTVIMVFLYSFDLLDKLKNIDISTKLYIAILGYIIGYAFQELFSIIGWVGTTYNKPGGLIQFLGKRFAPAEQWEKMPENSKIDIQSLRLCTDKHMVIETKIRNQRTINLKQLCSSMGSAGIIVSAFLLINIIKNCDRFSWSIFLFSLFVTIILLIMNRIKNAQQRMLEIKSNSKCEKCNGSAVLNNQRV